MANFEKYYREFLRTGNLSFLKETYDASLVHLNKEISVHEIRRVWRGVSRGINDIGELIVSTDEGDTVVRSGEVSIRGVYGYAE
jgi:BirA family biotin operon repressor/biotin-[acetyl-CoA-carboxylase] ligase